MFYGSICHENIKYFCTVNIHDKKMVTFIVTNIIGFDYNL